MWLNKNLKAEVSVDEYSMLPDSLKDSKGNALRMVEAIKRADDDKSGVG